MPFISFYADKIAKLAQLSIDNPESRRPNMEQRYCTLFLRDDLTAERREEILEGADEYFSLDIQDDEIDLKKIPAGVWLVGDEGIYIMMNLSMSEPGLILDPIEHAVQCFETDPRNGRDQYEEKRRIFGGDDGTIFIAAEDILRACSEVKRKDTPPVVMFIITPESLSIASPTGARSHARSMITAYGADYFDPDKKAPPKLWSSPTKAEPDQAPGFG